jgi:hypothetical protein
MSKVTPTEEQKAYWISVVSEGKRFLERLKLEKVAIEEIGILEPQLRKKVILHLGFDPRKIEDFFYLIDKFPESNLTKISQSRQVWGDYRITRQALRRWPAYNSSAPWNKKKK